MPNNSLSFGVDVLPNTTGTYNLGNESKQWKVNGKTLGDACEKGVDTQIMAGSSSAALPTTAAVAYFVEHKGYSTLGVRVDGTTLIFE